MIASHHKAVLLDIDGTLLDSNEAHARAWVEILERHGYPTTYERVRPLIGKGGDKLLEELVGFDDTTDAGKAMSADRKALFKADYVATLRPTDGARDLLVALQRRGLDLVVATSATGGELDDLLTRAGVRDLIDAASTSSDAEHSKPDGDIVAAALAKGGIAPHEAVMLGDTPYDIEAARRCGVDTIALRCGGWWDDDALRGAIALYDSPADLLRHLDDEARAAVDVLKSI